MAEVKQQLEFNFTLNAIDQDTNETIELYDYVESVNIVKRFTSSYFSKYNLKLKLTNKLYDKLDNANVLYYLKITAKPKNTTSTPVDERLVSHVLKPYNNPSGLKITKDEIDGSPTKESMPMFEFTAECFNINDLNRNKRVINNIYNEATTFDVITHITTNDPSINSGDIVVVDTPDSNERYKTILIPPLNPVKSIEYLQTVYNVYKNGMLIFMDGGALYVSKINGPSDNSSDANKHRITYKFLNDTQLSNDNRGIFIDPETNAVTIYSDTLPAVSIRTENINESIGENITIGSYDNKFDPYTETIERAEVKNSAYAKSAYYWRNYLPDGINKSFIESTQSSNTDVIINWQDLNPETFTPITEINIKNTLNSDGLYRVNTVSYTLVKKKIMIGSCSLRKIKNK